MSLAADVAAQTIQINGAGATFPYPIYSKWFAEYNNLSKISPEWKSKVGVATSVNWPTGVGGRGNEGVAGLVSQTPGAIGYVELMYALQNKIAYYEDWHRQAWAGALVLVTMVLVCSLLARFATRRLERMHARA